MRISLEITFWKELKTDFSTGIHFITPGENHVSNYVQNFISDEILIGTLAQFYFLFHFEYFCFYTRI